jgi:hypothetical protein
MYNYYVIWFGEADGFEVFFGRAHCTAFCNTTHKAIFWYYNKILCVAWARQWSGYALVALQRLCTVAPWGAAKATATIPHAGKLRLKCLKTVPKCAFLLQ